MYNQYIKADLIKTRDTEEINKQRKQGLIINQRDFIDAIKQEDFELIKYMVEELKVDINIEASVDGEWLAPSFEALKCENSEIFIYLMEHGGILYNKYNRGVRSYLEGAAEFHNFDAVRYLIEKKKVNLKAWENKRALYAAYRENQRQMVKYLIEKGIDVNASYETPYCTTSVLLRACNMFDYEMAEYFIKNGANVNFNGVDYQVIAERPIATPLMAACKHGNLKLAKLLVKNGANVNEVCRHYPYKRPSTLHIAYDSGNMELVKFLVENGAQIVPEKVFARNLELDYSMPGKSVFNKACEDKNIEMMQFLYQHGAAINNIYYIEDDKRFTRSEWYPYTSLNYACIEGDELVAKELLEMGANPNPDNEFKEVQKFGYHRSVRELVPIWTAMICKQTNISKLFYLKGHPVAIPSGAENFFPYWFSGESLSEKERKEVVERTDLKRKESFVAYMKQLALYDQLYKNNKHLEQEENEDE